MSSSESEEFYDAIDITPQREWQCHDHVRKEKLMTVGDSDDTIVQANGLVEQMYHHNADVNVQRRRKLAEMRQMMSGDDPPQSLNFPAADISLQSSGSELHSVSHLPLGLRLSEETVTTKLEASIDFQLEETEPARSVIEHGDKGGNPLAQEPDLIQSVKSSSLGHGQSSLKESIEERDYTHNSQYNRVPTVSIHTPDDGDAALQMPPPPIVPPRRRNKVAQCTYQQTDDIVGRISSTNCPVTSPPESLPLPRQTQTGGACLLTAPSPRLAHRQLHLSDLSYGENVVSAAEDINTRAINDVYKDNVSIYDTESLASETTMATASSDQNDGQVDGQMEAHSLIMGAELMVRTSGKSASFPRGQQPLSECELTQEQQAMLDTVSVLNLHTGERIPLSLAEEKLPASINPLSLHIMRRTKEYLSDTSLCAGNQGENAEAPETDVTIVTVKGLSKKKKKLKSLFGKAKNKLMSVKDEVFHHPESSSSEEDEDGDRRLIKVKASKSHKGPYDFDLLVPVQNTEGGHDGAVWTMKFSQCGRLLATGGQDNLLKVWVLKDAYPFFNAMRSKYSQEQKKMSPAESDESVRGETELQGEEWFSPFNKKPFCTYKGHTADILDLSWSKNYFILTSSMDKTVRLWHVSRKECLCCFQHIDFVTAISFHPKDDRYFLSGSLDGKLRLWSIPERKVELWNEVGGSTKLITAANFCMKGKFAVVGTYDGRCVFYSTEQLKYYTQIHVRSTRGKNSKGRKITGVESMPGEDKLLVTSNDSRVRIYDLRDLTLTCKYRGCVNNSSQIKACFSHDGRFVVCGSEDQFVYIWRTQHEFHTFSSARRDRSDYWEAIKAHNAVVTVAIFAPKPDLVIKNQFEYLDSDDKQSTPQVRGEVLISADYNGTIKCFINKFKPEVNA